ncbi:hypothetical protein [Paenibacillus sp. DMB20]|uniref:hypothetical protein n=1 Tax=Paenibacillus sp. DMB20 TaxID=1642570 RepID=UPI000627E753|nr:hypothetical protein [Paenibacillus sp. DMB20]KKO52586.1 hypothetical protein XI25_18955 [Paenibacillus sp. DMB20]
MKKEILLTFAGLIGILTVFVYWLTQTGEPKLPMSKEEKAAAAYVESFGYTIHKRSGKIHTYILEKSFFRSGSGQTPYIQTWSVQSRDPADFFGKEISGYRFTVSGHLLDKMYDTHTQIYVMMADGRVIGGTSFPDKDDLAGAPYSIDGKTLEEVTGISYGEWRKRWEEKYSD